jgi:hypothetical protein
MAEIINGLIVTASNASKKGAQRASVTVKTPTGAIAARIYSDHSKPLTYLRRWMLCDERLELIDKLQRAGLKQEDIDAIVAMKG